MYILVRKPAHSTESTVHGLTSARSVAIAWTAGGEENHVVIAKTTKQGGGVSAEPLKLRPTVSNPNAS